MRGKLRYFLFLVSIALPSPLLATPGNTVSKGLHPIDWCIVAAYAIGMVAIGVIYARKESDDLDYFIGGGRMNPILVGISLFATLFSTISYLSQPGEVIKNGPFILFIFCSIPFAYLAVGYWLIPAYMKQRVVSAYQLLEANLGPSVRRLGAGLFVTLRLVWMSVLIYMASSAIVVIAGLEPDKIQWVIACAGTIAVVYTTLGGLKAVVISDVAQSLILFLGAVATIGIVTWRVGGFSWFPTTWDPRWDMQPIFSFDPHVRVTVIGVIVMNFFWQICTAGGDQTAIQRYMSTTDIRAARRAFLINSVLGVVVALLVATVGFALLGYYTFFPEELPPGESIDTYADQLFPTFIGMELPVGMAGFVVSALFAAAMSSVDSGINSITAVTQRDFMQGIYNRLSEEGKLRLARWLALGIGLCVVLIATQIGNVPGNLLEIAKKTTNLFAAPIFGLFFLALFCRRVNTTGAWVGTSWGFSISLVIAYWDVLTGLRPISFMYIIPPALLAQVGIALLLSRFPLPARKSNRALLTAALALPPIILIIWRALTI